VPQAGEASRKETHIMVRRSMRAALFALALSALALPSAALAAGPVHTHFSFTYTLADALADYQAFGDNDGDCGAFVLLVDFHVERDVVRWPDREIRHVKYTGNFFSSADTSRSIPRNGNFELTIALDENGEPESITRTGVMQYVIIDGQRVVTVAGRDLLSFATGPVSATPKAGAEVRQVVCDALD
jgi:hypothetical protein